MKLILNSRRIALQIVELLKEDERIHRELNPIEDKPICCKKVDNIINL